MKVIVAAAGKLKDAGLRALVDDYKRRIARYTAVDEVELKDGRAADWSARLGRLRGRQKSFAVLLDVDGASMSSPDFARFVEARQLESVATLIFIIGGAYGVPSDVRRTADGRLSLGPMTLPHRLARLVLVEQIYRAFTILRNEPYSHD